MPEQSNGQPKPTPPTTKNAIAWAAVVGLGTAGLVFWILSSQGFAARLIAGIVGGAAVAISSYRKSVAASARSGKNSNGKSV